MPKGIPERETDVPALYFLAESPDGCSTVRELKRKILKACFPGRARFGQWNIVSNRAPETQKSNRGSNSANLVFRGLVAFEVQNEDGRWEDFSRESEGPKEGRKKRPERLRITEEGRCLLGALRRGADTEDEQWFCGAEIPSDLNKSTE